MWLRSRVCRSHGEPHRWPVKWHRWPGKSGSFPSALQRQRDVRGRRPFPANQRETCREEGTPPSTFAQAEMGFPYLCWLFGIWQYLCPIWLNTRRHLLGLYSEEKLQTSVKCVYHPTSFTDWVDSFAYRSSFISHLYFVVLLFFWLITAFSFICHHLNLKANVFLLP